MCTNFRILAKDTSVVIGRTMEFGVDLQSKLTVFPKGFKFVGTGPDNKSGFSWEGSYGFVGMDILGMPMVSDGINEMGLYVGDLYLPGFAKYQDIPAGEESKALSPLDVAGYLLSSCQNVAEAKEAIQKVYVWPFFAEQIKTIPPLHFAVHDASGKSAVFEYIDGKLAIHDNPIGVLTNSPYFDWHMINLGNYSNLSANNVPALKLDGGEASPIGQGSGMLGLPGDATPPSRFIKAVALTQSAVKAENADEATRTAFHVVNNFDIPKGFARQVANGQTFYDYTSWLTIADLSQKIYYYRGYDNIKFYRVSLKNIDFSVQEIKRLDTTNADWYQEIS
ncbi:MAG: choloylglycine hydrolase family protein [Candidatus Levybacteria bacterium]|nr:choloylglycine hydrolase family protein [Candidatus Levybacteria bacterium]